MCVCSTQFGGREPKKPAVRSSAVGNCEGENSSRGGLREPIVVREKPSWRGRAGGPLDASLVETHVAGRASGALPVGEGGGCVVCYTVHSASLYTASLTKLKDKEKTFRSRSLLSSLEQSEVYIIYLRVTINYGN